MLCGVAVVAHDFPELANIVRKASCGRLVDSKNPRSIADGVNSLLDRPELLSVCGSNGRQAVLNHYNYRTQCEDMINMYERILKRRA
jgi:glycosyltransferase involved in cell wall biosynthesis